MKLYPGTNKIAYVKPGMSFSEGLSFFTNDNGCLDMLYWVRNGQICVYCDCIVDNADDNLNSVEENVGLSTHMDADNSVVGDKDGDYYLESSWISSDYGVIISSEDDEFEVVFGKRRRSRDLERKVSGLREDNEEEVDEREDDGNVDHP